MKQIQSRERTMGRRKNLNVCLVASHLKFIIIHESISVTRAAIFDLQETISSKDEALKEKYS